jgi:hypothetical protein
MSCPLVLGISFVQLRRRPLSLLLFKEKAAPCVLSAIPFWEKEQDLGVSKDREGLVLRRGR